MKVGWCPTLQSRRKLAIDQDANTRDRDVRRRISGAVCRVERVAALARDQSRRTQRQHSLRIRIADAQRAAARAVGGSQSVTTRTSAVIELPMKQLR